MKIPISYVAALALCATLLLEVTPPATACGPNVMEPIFISRNSPDLPFDDFTRGNIGIVQPSFGRKTLVIAYRYLNGGYFTEGEQHDLVEALKGKAPENEGVEAVKAWVAERKRFLPEDETLSQIYIERQYVGGFNFFPNCTPNAFEVATETLKARSATYGTDDKDVLEWIAGQDTVFKNCAGGSNVPAEIGTDKPDWLRKDRDYQIGAALFYSLNLDQARSQFERIALDNNSPWQEIAGYLVGRTLVRHASLARTPREKHELYQRAESYLRTLVTKDGKYAGASKRLLGLVKYRLHPQERVGELAHVLTTQSGNENLRQDLIDYVWLVDKFEGQVIRDEASRAAAAKLTADVEELQDSIANAERDEAVANGDLIDVRIYFNTPQDIGRTVVLYLKPDASEAEALGAAQKEAGRALTTDDIQSVKNAYSSAMSQREWLMRPNYRLRNFGYEGEYSEDKLKLDLLPDFLRQDDLTDWIFTTQDAGTESHRHAYRKWRDTDSNAWLVSALISAGTKSKHLTRLMSAAQRIEPSSPAYATATFHLIRLKSALGEQDEARHLLDEMMATHVDRLPVSAGNLFREQQMELAPDFQQFLASSLRKPMAFYDEGRIASLQDLFDSDKRAWETYSDTYDSTEQFDESYAGLLVWDRRLMFNAGSADTFNTYLSVELLSKAAVSRAIPSYLRKHLTLAAWTRAALLDQHEEASKLAPNVVRVAPELKEIFSHYLNANTPKEKRYAALFVMLKSPSLSPFVAGGIPLSVSEDDLSYYFATAWWCRPEQTELTMSGEEVPKVIPKPAFLSPQQLAEAKREHAALVEIGDAKSFLGRQVISWAEVSPSDPRVPEALFIAFKANQEYKYGCSGWSHDSAAKEKAAAILRQRYPQTVWAAKLDEPRN